MTVARAFQPARSPTARTRSYNAVKFFWHRGGVVPQVGPQRRRIEFCSDKRRQPRRDPSGHEKEIRIFNHLRL